MQELCFKEKGKDDVVGQSVRARSRFLNNNAYGNRTGLFGHDVRLQQNKNKNK